MTTRTIDEILADVKQAFSVDDADLLMKYATELDALQTPLATAGANRSRGQALYLRGDYPAALTSNQHTLALYEELGDRAGMASATVGIGNVHFRTGEYLAALDHYHRALALHDGLGDLSGVALVSDNIGSVLRRKGDYVAALEYYQRALSLHEELDNRRGAATVLGNIGIVLNDTGDYPSALEYYHRALALNEEHGNRKGIASNTGNIGTVYYRTGDYPAVLEHYYRALAIHEELKDRDNVALITGNIGAVYMTTGDFPAALEHYDRASTLYEEDGDRSGMARILGNIGNVHAASEDYPEAMKYHRRALAICEELGERSHASIIKANLLSMHVSIGDDAEALALLDTMDLMQIAEPGVRVHCELSRATLLQRNDDLDGATVSLQRALSEALERGLRSEAARAHRGLREIALEQNNLAGYVEHNNEYTRITEEISGKDATTKLAMQARQREIDAERKETEKYMAVLHSTLPRHIADRVARGETVNDHYDNATVIFLDIVGFTTISDRIPSGHVVHLLEQIFTTLDAVCDRHAVVRIKTIGDSYMAVSFDSVMNAAACALDMITSLDALEIVVPPEQGDVSWTKDIGEIKVRIGMHSGPVTAGVIGTVRMQYDVWGDTVNTASRMESTGEPGRIQVSESFAQGLRAMDEGRSEDPTEEPLAPRPYSLALRGTIEVKGKGSMTTYWLE